MTIKKVGGKYEVVSEKSGKVLAKPTTKEKAVKRLRQIEYFKHHKAMGGHAPSPDHKGH
jgi:hypothetical protein